jgi:hypothetical protein
MLTLQQQKIEAELTAQRAEQMGWLNDELEFFKTTLNLYQVPNQIKFYEFGHCQDLDDVVVSDFFKSQPTGRFLCIGSANGIDQTRSLLEKGWSGVYCEPDPVALSDNDGHGLLRATKEFRDKIVIVNAAITSTSDVCEFYINKTIALSTTKKEWADNDSIPIIINSLGVNQLLDYVGEDFDYVQIDAEGADVEIVNSIDWSKRLPNCKMIGVELGIQNWIQLWNQGNYVIASVTEHNMYFRRLDLKNE